MNTALDDLRAKAIEMIATNTELTRRPTWAPTILVGEELLELLFDLSWLTGDDLALARLWSRFTTPKRGRVRCDGFELRAGRERRGEKIWEGEYFDKELVLANTRRHIAEAQDPKVRAWLEDAYRRTEAKTGGWTFGPRWMGSGVPGRLEKLKRVVELGHGRVMDFAGAPGEQMRAGGKYCGHCCICGKALTDPHSIELGIGPECRKGDDIRQMPGAWIIGGRDDSGPAIQTIKREER